MSIKHYVGQDLTGFADNGKTRPISRVTLMRDDDNGVTAGDDTGMEISSVCPYATQEMAEAILEHLKGYQYQMYTADAVNIDPAAELGDGITVNGIYGVISRIADDGGGYPDISGPGEAEMEDEFPISEGPQMRELRRKVLGQAYSRIAKTAEEVRAEVKNDLSGLSSSIDVQLEAIDEQVLGLDGRMGEVEITAETVLTRVNGLDDAYAEISTEVGTISATVKGIDGRMTMVEETASGLSATVSGLDGRMTKAEQTAGKVNWLIQDGTDATNFTLTSRISELVSQAINIKGYVTIENIGTPGKVEIDGGNIKAHTLSADALDVEDLVALHAKIGGWSIADASGLVYEDDTRGAGIRPNNSGSVIYIGKRANKDADWEYPYYVSADGQLHAEDAYIVGEVHAKSGTFENITIGNATISGSEFDGKLNSATGTLNGVTGTFSGTHSGGSLSNTGGSFTGTNSGKLTGTAQNAALNKCGLNDSELYLSTAKTSYLHMSGGRTVLSSAVEVLLQVQGGAGGGGSSINMGKTLWLNGDVRVDGSFTVENGGAKSRAIATRHFGIRCLDALETPLPTFADYGEGTLDASGVCCLAMDPVFLETVDPDLAPTVFLTKYGEGDIWYDRDAGTQDMLVVRGTPGLAFAWEARFAQSNIDLQRLRVLDYDYMDLGGEADFVGDALAEWDRDPLNVDYAEEAFDYITEFERSLEAA